ncbi:MAG: hypothetical protein V3V01_04130 [Acidimicrobiales bacterium]
MILDAGVLISVDRGDRAAGELIAAALRNETSLATTHPVVAQVWRNGARQARLAKFLTSLVVHPFDDGPAVGNLLARSNTTDVVDAHLVILAVRQSEPILTSDMDDIEILASALQTHRPEVFQWP